MKRNIIVIIIVILTFIGVVCFIEYNKRYWKQYDLKFKALDKDIVVTIYDKEGNVNKYLKEVKKIYKKYDQLTSTSTKYNNNLYVINHNKKQAKLNKELENMIKYANNYDININNNELITYYNDVFKNKKKMPGSDELSKIKTSNKKISIQNHMITNKDISINLDYIKAYYVTSVAKEYLENNNILNYSINVDGDLTLGKNYEGVFSTALLNPIDNSLNKIVYGNDISIVSIGKNNTYYNINNQLYTNIIDIDTKKPFRKVLSITVIAKDVKISGFYAYKLFGMDIDDGKKFAKDNNLAVMWVSNDREIITNDLFESYTKQVRTTK